MASIYIFDEIVNKLVDEDILVLTKLDYKTFNFGSSEGIINLGVSEKNVGRVIHCLRERKLRTIGTTLGVFNSDVYDGAYQTYIIEMI